LKQNAKEKNYFRKICAKKVCCKIDQQQNGLHQSGCTIKLCTPIQISSLPNVSASLLPRCPCIKDCLLFQASNTIHYKPIVHRSCKCITKYPLLPCGHLSVTILPQTFFFIAVPCNNQSPPSPVFLLTQLPLQPLRFHSHQQLCSSTKAKPTQLF